MENNDMLLDKLFVHDPSPDLIVLFLWRFLFSLNNLITSVRFNLHNIFKKDKSCIHTTKTL